MFHRGVSSQDHISNNMDYNNDVINQKLTKLLYTKFVAVEFLFFF